MDKQYDHSKHEGQIYSLWENSDFFSPQISKKKKPFCIIMPPPNANDPLHIGHARFIAIQDILIRYHRMLGKSSLWLPGADHAGIETQYVYEKRLQKKGKSRFDYSPDTLYKMIWKYVMSNKDVMESQLKSLGASCDWKRNKFTLDPDIQKIVYLTFKKLDDDGLLYRGERIVNYCPGCGTSFSELEVMHIERKDPFYTLNYGPLNIATTRPETIFADVAVAVNPKDTRYKKLVGKNAIIPLVKREVPIISDPLVDSDFGTGALKITPGHDHTDFEIGEKHSLPIVSVIDSSGKMINTPKAYSGMPVGQARDAVVSDLKKQKMLSNTEMIKHTIGTCYKHKTPIEPSIAKQWLIKMEPLAKHALSSIGDKSTSFVDKKYEKISRHWLKNIKDWNISRQIVWGIKIPAWKCQKCLTWTITSGSKPKKCSDCNHNKLIRDKDTFDTWFSSGQWPYATLLTDKKAQYKMSPSRLADKNPASDFNYFYPTSIMVTAYDILLFWVLRMIMLGIYVTGKVPFNEVLIYGLVRDSGGQKISKSKGNVIDPIEMANKYGADALRMSLVWGALIVNDISLSEDNIKGQRNFSNKIWNIARFVSNSKPERLSFNEGLYKKPRVRHKADREILNNLSSTIKGTTKLLNKYRLNEAAELLYDFVWNSFANTYIESSKNRKDEAWPILNYTLATTLKLLHPFMPFLTEAIWQRIYSKSKNKYLISTSWPS